MSSLEQTFVNRISSVCSARVTRWAKITVYASLILSSGLQMGCATTSAPVQTQDKAPDVVRPTLSAAGGEKQESAKGDSDNSLTNTTRESDKYASNPASVTLREQANSALENKDLRQAVRLLERALRIDSRDPATYYVFAKLRNQQDRSPAALQLIDKGLSLRPGAALKAKLLALRDSISPPLDS